MKWLPRILVAGMILTFSRGLTAQDLKPANLLTNGGFEQGVAGWQPDAQHEHIVDTAVAHQGKACLAGEVTQPRQALILRRRVPVRAGNRRQP